MLNTRLSRRAILAGASSAGIVAALALSGCTTVTSGTTTVVTLNVAKITAYATAGLNAVTTVTNALAMFPALSNYLAPVQAVEQVLQVALANFTAAAGSNVTVTYNDASIKTAVDTVLSAIQSIATQVAAIVVAMAKQTALGLSDKTVSTVQLAYSALSTIISVFQALLTTNVALAIPAAPPRLAMSEAQALRVLNA